MKNKKKINRKPDTFSLISIIITLLVIVFISSAIISVVAGGVAYLPEALTSRETWFSIKLSLKTATISTTLCVLTAIPVAYALTRTEMPLKKLSEIIIELMMCLPYLVLGLCLLILFSSPFGDFLRDIGFKVVFTVNGIIIAQYFVNLPFAIRMIRTAFMQMDERLEVIAGMLGASKWKQMTTILLPLARNSIISMIILTWSRAIGEFGATLMLVGITRMRTETLPGSIYLSISTGDTKRAMASATIMLVISVAALIISNKLNEPPKYYRIGGEDGK
ncbi:MAG: ABC transporter permease [Oscillospiraceae bacterium]|nr:ABC transporter permease [Oscillospiraceae bacterium]